MAASIAMPVGALNWPWEAWRRQGEGQAMRWIAAGIVAAVTALGNADAQVGEGAPGWSVDKQGCRLWNSNPQANESISWNGVCPNGLASGEGVAQWYQNGQPTDRYDGEWKDGRENGHGVAVAANGDLYEGEWRDGRRNGHGVYLWANGDRYDGQWKDDRQNGHGVLVWAGGDRYEGEWRDGLRNGHGVYLWANGDRYEGQYRDDRPDGYGTYRSGNGEFSGNWVKGCFRDAARRASVGVSAAECR